MAVAIVNPHIPRVVVVPPKNAALSVSLSVANTAHRVAACNIHYIQHL